MLTAGALLQYLAWIYMGAAALTILWVLKFAKSTKSKAVAAFIVLALFSYWPMSSYLKVYHETKLKQERINLAIARFDERCKTAGEKIYRIAEDVEGLLIMNDRPHPAQGENSNPMWLEAGIPDRFGDDYLISFLRNTERYPEYLDPQGNSIYKGSVGFRYVDVIDHVSGGRFRYSAPYAIGDGSVGKPVQTLVKRLTAEEFPKFGVIYEAFVDSNDRMYWVAGGVIRVIDLQTKQVMAEKIGFLLDSGQGSTAGFRSPWGWASSNGPKCPKDWGQGTPVRSFVDRVLKPKKGE